MIETYLRIKAILEPIVFGPGIFWALFIIYLFYYRSKNDKRKNIAKKIPFVSLILIIVVISPPFVEIVSLPLYYATPENLDKNADAIVVLGGGIDDSGAPGQSSTRRAYLGSQLFLQGRAPRLILSTGYTDSEVNKSEAQAMRIIAIGMGVPDHKIILEEKSYNTYTNALETKKILEKNNLKSIILVTSFSHLYRAVKVFNKIGIEAYPYASGTSRLFNFEIGWWRPVMIMELSHEYIAIVIYKVKGWL